ncbi:VanZ family protein [Halobellus salinisoli]|uniref:VanZ family protein n=1 Tax=Halobellus salinisoli TaxID=3108500 RepID=UPI00300AE7AC
MDDGAVSQQNSRSRRPSHPSRHRSSRRARRLAASWIGLVVLVSVVDPAVVFDAVSGVANAASEPTASGSNPGASIGIVGATASRINVFALSHVVAYGVLAWLLADGLGGRGGTDGGGSHRGRRLLIAVILASIVGLGVELAQAPLPVRTASTVDAAVNALGAVAGVGVREGIRAARGSRH